MNCENKNIRKPVEIKKDWKKEKERKEFRALGVKIATVFEEYVYSDRYTGEEFTPLSMWQYLIISASMHLDSMYNGFESVEEGNVFDQLCYELRDTFKEHNSIDKCPYVKKEIDNMVSEIKKCR